MNGNFSKLQLWRDTTIAFLAGVTGSLVVVFSWQNEQLQTGVFWAYLVVMYLVVVGLMFLVTMIFRSDKPKDK